MPEASASNAAAGNPPSGSNRLLSSELGADIAFLIARAQAVSIGPANTVLAPFDLKVRSLSVLWLAAQGLAPSQRELSDFLNLDPSQVVALVDDLERRALVERTADPRDRRSRIITATPAGKRLLTKALTAAKDANAQSFGDLSPDEQETLTELLTRIAFRQL